MHVDTNPSAINVEQIVQRFDGFRGKMAIVKSGVSYSYDVKEFEYTGSIDESEFLEVMKEIEAMRAPLTTKQSLKSRFSQYLIYGGIAAVIYIIIVHFISDEMVRYMFLLVVGVIYIFSLFYYLFLHLRCKTLSNRYDAEIGHYLDVLNTNIYEKKYCDWEHVVSIRKSEGLCIRTRRDSWIEFSSPLNLPDHDQGISAAVPANTQVFTSPVLLARKSSMSRRVKLFSTPKRQENYFFEIEKSEAKEEKRPRLGEIFRAFEDPAPNNFPQHRMQSNSTSMKTTPQNVNLGADMLDPVDYDSVSEPGGVYSPTSSVSISGTPNLESRTILSGASPQINEENEKDVDSEPEDAELTFSRILPEDSFDSSRMILNKGTPLSS